MRFRNLSGIIFSLALLMLTFCIPNVEVLDIPDVLTLTHQEFSELKDESTMRVNENTVLDYTVKQASAAGDNAKLLIRKGKTPLKEVLINLVDEKRVQVGGVPIGFTMYTDGVIIVGVSDVKTSDGYQKPAANSNVLTGDILKNVNGKEVYSAADIDNALNTEECKGKSAALVLLRRGERIECNVNPALDVLSNKYKLGVWIRDSAAGIGTLTYIKEGKRFGALGHPISDIDTGTILPVRTGDVYNCSIVGVQKSERGTPGELKGVFLKGGKKIGALDKNNKFGVFGNLETVPDNGIYKTQLPVANRAAVKPGKATIVTTVGGEAGEYDIEIIKTNYQKTQEDKSMIIKVTDKRLIERTGGIVQGMSGSPIIQNGKVAGAVTHVFINDATKGFGVYLDWMYEE